LIRLQKTYGDLAAPAAVPSPLRGGVGGGGQRALNLAQHPVEISKHFMVPEPQHAVAAGFDLQRTPIVCATLRVMLSAIQLNDELGLAAREIDDERSDDR
jgi:hypothetical protein